MRIAVLGAGRMGAALSGAFARASHDVLLASRDPERAKIRAQAAGPRVAPAAPRHAVEQADLAALATLWEDAPAMLSLAGDFGGKVLIDATNPESGRGLAVGLSTSGAEEIAKVARNARVVKAFNHLYAEVLDRGGCFDRERASVFFCGDDEAARRDAARLIGECGFTAVDAGPLDRARFLEPAAMLMVELVRGRGNEAGSVALHLLRRSSPAGAPA